MKIRLLEPRDLPRADELRALAGWNQTLADWERSRSIEPEGCFAAEWNGTVTGTATVTCYGREMAWIGMVLVHPDYRRRGIGTALLKHAIDCLRARGIAPIKLDATPEGQPVYEALGFRPEWTIQRWEIPWLAAPIASTDSTAHRLVSIEAAALLTADRTAFGADRSRLLGKLLEASEVSLWLETERKEARSAPAAYGMLRPGSKADYLGPAVAIDAESGLRLIEALLQEAAQTKANPRPVFWDIPDPNRPAVALARRLGFRPQRVLTRMFLGENAQPGRPEMQFAIADPSAG